MARTTETAVKGVLRLGSEGGDYDDANNPDLSPYIDSASLIVDRLVTRASNKGFTLTTNEKEMIERWLAAHSYVMSDQTYASRSTSRASASFHGQTGMGLDASKYGQYAKALDPSGCLATLFYGKRAGGFWLGKTDSEKLDYEQRQ